MFGFLLLEEMNSAAAQCISSYIFSSSNWFSLSKDMREVMSSCISSFCHRPEPGTDYDTVLCITRLLSFSLCCQVQAGQGCDWPAWDQPVVTQIKLMQTRRKRKAETKQVFLTCMHCQAAQSDLFENSDILLSNFPYTFWKCIIIVSKSRTFALGTAATKKSEAAWIALSSPGLRTLLTHTESSLLCTLSHSQHWSNWSLTLASNQESSQSIFGPTITSIIVWYYCYRFCIETITLPEWLWTPDLLCSISII